MQMLTEADIADRTALSQLFEKRKVNKETKAGFFCFEDQDLMIAQGQETYVVVARDMAVGFPLFMEGELDFSKFERAMSLLREVGVLPISVMWDIGANIGSICIPALTRKFVDRVVAFEPEKQLFKILRANTILNDVDHRIKCHNIAVGSSRSLINITIPEGNTGDYRIVGQTFEDDSMGEALRRLQQVSMHPMDEFISDFIPKSTLLYMDIQGYEGIALLGAKTILSNSPPLVAEFWPYGMKRALSYKSFREVICSGFYSKFANLSQEIPEFMDLSPEAIDSIYNTLGEKSDSFTDLLFI